VKSGQQQRPVSTLGFSEWKMSAVEITLEKTASSRGSVALVDDEATDKTDAKSKQVYAAAYFIFLCL